MADGEPIVIRLREARRIRVRYGRAFVTIARFGGLSAGEFERRLASYRDGDVDAEAVCWAFVHERVIDHTPSFDWADVELPLLLDRVVGISTNPEFSSSEPEEVVAALVDALQEEREAAERARQRIHQLVQQVTGQFNLGARLRETLGGFNVGGSVLGKVGISSALDQYFKGTLVSQTASDAAKQIAARSGVQGQLAESAGIASRVIGESPGIARLRKSLIADVIPLAGFGLRLAGKDLRTRFIGANNFAHLAQLPALQGLGKALSESYRPLLLRQLAGRPDIFKGIFDRSRDWIEVFKRALPVNWRKLDSAEIDDAVKLMLEVGLSLAWAPRASIIRELLEAESDEHTVILEARSTEIVEDVEAVLERITSPRLQMSVEACEEAIATYRAGHPSPALAYASAVLTDLVHTHFDGSIRVEFEGVDPFNDVGYVDFPRYSVGRVWVRSWKRFEDNPDPAYNRNRTLHLIGDHYSVANLLAALMLVASVLCELQRLEDRGETEAPDSVPLSLVA